MAWATYRSPSCVVHCASLKVGGKLDRKVGKHPMSAGKLVVLLFLVDEFTQSNPVHLTVGLSQNGCIQRVQHATSEAETQKPLRQAHPKKVQGHGGWKTILGADGKKSFHRRQVTPTDG